LQLCKIHVKNYLFDQAVEQEAYPFSKYISERGVTINSDRCQCPGDTAFDVHTGLVQQSCRQLPRHGRAAPRWSPWFKQHVARACFGHTFEKSLRDAISSTTPAASRQFPQAAPHHPEKISADAHALHRSAAHCIQADDPDGPVVLSGTTGS